MALEEAAAWLDDGLTLPIAGKKYRVPEPSVELGMRLEVLLNTDREQRPGSERYQQVLSDVEERDLYEEILGPAYGQMAADGVSYPLVKHAALTAWYHFVISPEVAERYWNEAVTRGKASPQPSSRSSRPATRRTGAAATTTKPRASGSGTRPRRSS